MQKKQTVLQVKKYTAFILNSIVYVLNYNYKSPVRDEMFIDLHKLKEHKINLLEWHRKYL